VDLKNKILTATAGVFLFYGLSFAQYDRPIESSGDLQFYLDKTVFSGRDNNQYVEFYLMFFSDKISFTRGNKGEMNVKMKINYETGKNFSEKDWNLEVSLSEDKTGIGIKVFYDQTYEYLPAGRYKIVVTVTDVDSTSKGEISGFAEIKEIGGSNLTTSEIEFVSSVDNNSGPEHFRKGNKFITANPSRRYGVLNPILFFYYEIYNIIPEEGKKLNVVYSINSLSGNYEKSFPALTVNKNNATIGISHGLNAGNLPSGIYKLNINVNDPDRKDSIDIVRSFEVIQLDYTEKKPVLSVEDSEVFEKILSIVGNEAQLKNYRRLSGSGKSAYILGFWKTMDPTPGTPENEYLAQIQQRFLYADKNFGWGKTKGWESERGRVLIKYGNPDEIEQHHSESGTYPYEIWIYNQARRYIFVFGDLSNNGRYVLLHSDKEGEISNTRWKDYLRKM